MCQPQSLKVRQEVIPQGCTIFSRVVFRYKMFLVNKHKYSLAIPDEIVQIGWKGVGYILLSGSLWIFTEHFCYTFDFVKYLFGHVWWHIFVSYGGYLLSLVPSYLTLRERYSTLYIKKDEFFIPYLDCN